MIGDILFYHAKPFSMADVFIVLNNRLRNFQSDIVHVAIDLGDSCLIEATPDGVKSRCYQESERFTRWTFPETYKQGQYKEHFDGAILALRKTEMLAYGWGDIVQAALVFNWPPIVVDPQHYDCSVLGMWFLLQTGYALILSKKIATRNMHEETPVMLAHDLEVV